MLVLQPQTTIEPLHSPSPGHHRARLLREAGPPGGGEGVSRVLSSLLQSQMFREQEGKLKWIAQRLERCVCVLRERVCVCVCVHYLHVYTHTQCCRMSVSWEKAAREMATTHNYLLTHPKNILLFLGLVYTLSLYLYLY